MHGLQSGFSWATGCNEGAITLDTFFVNKNADSPEERKWSFVLSSMDGQSGVLYTSVAVLLPVLSDVIRFSTSHRTSHRTSHHTSHRTSHARLTHVSPESHLLDIDMWFFR